MPLPFRSGHPCLHDMLIFRMDYRMDHDSSPSGDIAIWRNNYQRTVMEQLGMHERYTAAPRYRPYRILGRSKPIMSMESRELRMVRIGKTFYNIR